MKLNKIEILKDYISFCNDTKAKAKAKIKSKNNKEKYIKQYLLHAAKFYGIEHIEETEKQLHDILYYNNLTLPELIEEA